MQQTAESAEIDDAPCILILDDEVMILIDLSVAFEEVGMTVIQAQSVTQALAAIERGKPDAALLDVNLGRGQTCTAVARKLQALGVPTLLHTGDLRRQGEVAEQLDLPSVNKPMPSSQVVERLLTLLDG